MIKTSLIIISLFLLTSCRLSFKDTDLVSYNIYNVNDTLIFKNISGKTNKFEIISKTIINKGWDENTGLYNPQIAYVKYRDLSESDSIPFDNSFLTIYQVSRNEIEETICFKRFIGTINRKTQKTKEHISNFKGTVFKVTESDMSTFKDPSDILYIYWTDKDGIIAYDCKNGERWILTKK
jgi:hypothetical protein